jgi:hypothetical protein
MITEVFFAKDSWKTDVVKLVKVCIRKEVSLRGDYTLYGQHDPVPSLLLYW